MFHESNKIGRAGLVAAVEQAADSIIITDTNGIIQYVNPAFTAMTGYTSEEAVGSQPRILKSGRHNPAFYEGLWSTVGSGQVWKGSLVNRRKDGSLYDEEMQISPVRDEEGDIAGFIAIKRDVTLRRNADEAARFLAAIVNSSEAAIISSTPDGVILTWNRGAEATFGYPAADAIGKPLSMLMPPERLPKLAYFTNQLLQGVAVSQYESSCLRSDGRKIHVSVTGSPLINSDGQVVALAAILRDISANKEAEAALRESEQRFRLIADSCPAMIWMADAAG